VQSPTLGLIVEREMERARHVAKPFWEVVRQVQAPRRHLRGAPLGRQILGESRVRRGARGQLEPGHGEIGDGAQEHAQTADPYNTTAFSTDASSRLGITPASAMRIAEDLYMDGFISYPRTDNTVYPSSLPLRELVTSLVRIKEFSAASGLLDGALTPTRGKKETTAIRRSTRPRRFHHRRLGGTEETRLRTVVRRSSPPSVHR